MRDPLSIHDDLTAQYLRYYDTPFAVRDEAVMRERRELLLRDAAITREPWLEPIAPYAQRGEPFADSCALAGAHPDVADFASPGLLPPGARLRTHQFDALNAAAEGQHVILTAGTGSGKTESFLLPLFSSLLAESADWGQNGTPSGHEWWAQSKPKYAPQREHEAGRHAAVRGLILYPMNALVDDQLKRLRSALDSDRARTWLDQHRRGHRFYFGRYTSRTPLAGPIDSNRQRRLAKQLMTMAARARRVRDDEERRYFLAQLDGAEMRSRWDMQATPPDILITNYSMLNVMLLRGIEEPIFSATAQWLADSEDRRFTIVLDELHMYRGTPGTEIRFLLRNLLDRLGIARLPEKVRFLAASASAGGDTEAFDTFIKGFFAQPRERFTVVPGELDLPKFDAGPLDAAAGPLAEVGQYVAAGQLSEAREQLAVAAHTAGASDQTALGLCAAGQADAALLYATSYTDSTGQRAVRAQPASAIAATLFPNLERAGEQREALRGLLHAMQLSHDDRGGTTVRAHYFFRSIQGMWACSNGGCPGALRLRDEERTVGKLFRTHRLSCDECASRVLELLYCQTCGELFLGGFRAENPEHEPGAWYLVPDHPDLDRLPDFAISGRTSSNFALYWPRTEKPAVKPWKREGAQYRMAFTACDYDPKTGRLDAMPANGGSGITFQVTGPEGHGYPALPTKCPHCTDDWERTWAGRAEDPGRAQSPIRYMRTGFEKVTQVLGDALLRGIGTTSAERKLVAFTDSRQDAAKLSAGMERRHYEDTARQLLTRAMKAGTPGAGDLALFDRRLVGGEESPDVLAGYERFRAAHAADANVLMAATMPFASEHDKGTAAQVRARFRASSVAFDDLADETERQLLALGMNPAGRSLSSRMRHSALEISEQPPRCRAC